MNRKTRKREASPEMSEAERKAEADRAKQISDRYRQLLREVQLNPERIDSDPDFQEHLLREVKEIYPQWNATDGDIRVACSNSLMDAKIIRKLMSSLLKEAESGMTKFNVGEFSHNLAIKGMDATVDDEGKMSLISGNWIEFGRSSTRIFKQFSGLKYLFGALDEVTSLSESSSANTQNVPKPKAAKHAQEEVVQTKLKMLNVRDDEGVSIERDVDMVFQLLSREYTKSGGNLSMLEFTLDPNSYTDTIRNLFYLSYLVKEQRVILQMVDGLPFIRPKNLVFGQNTQTSESEESFESNQMIFSINHEQYKKLIEALEIKTPMIVLK